MLQTEYIRNLNCNYERIVLDKKPEENRYQYCMLGRGGIRGLLPCSLRYLNGLAYLYYDISSTQNVSQLYGSRKITRQWMKDFIWSMRQIRRELDRFLLDEHNIIWNPEYIYQDLERNDFLFLYFPYYEGECGFMQLIDFWVEHIDYEDDTLVECIYKMHEQYELLGDVYLQEKVFEDAGVLEEKKEIAPSYVGEKIKNFPVNVDEGSTAAEIENVGKNIRQDEAESKTQRKNIWYLFENRMKKQKEERAGYRQDIQDNMAGYAVSEETVYEAKDLGKTIFIEEAAEQQTETRGLYSQDGQQAVLLEKPVFVIGKKQEEADYVLKDNSVSRVHARILQEDGKVYLEDLNSTNGTFKNGLRLQPYEKRCLEQEDEIRLGKVILIFR